MALRATKSNENDSYGNAIDFMLWLYREPNRGEARSSACIVADRSDPPTVINVDGNPEYARAIPDLKDGGEFSSHCRP